MLDIIDRDFTLLLDNLPVGIIRLDETKRCVYVNRLIYELFEIPISNTSNQSTILYEIFRRIHQEDLDKFRLDDQRFLLDKIEGESTFRIWKESIHNWVWVTNKKILIRDFNNSLNQVSFMYTFQDINETKTMEIQLREQRLKIERAYNHKSIFLANISHEIRTPIHGVVGMLTLLEDTVLTQEQIDYVNMIKECSFNLMTIINDILDYSKLEIGKIVLDNKPTNLRECIESVNDIVISRIIDKSIEYTYNIENDVNVCILCDPNRLKQIILNLVSNSIKFTDSGNILINVAKISKKDYILLKRHSKYEIEERDILDPEDTLYLRFDITDTGHGIDISERDKLFKSFSQIDNNKIKVYGGTGLGLAICKELTELMGGYIWLDWSERNNGSRFSFVIKTTAIVCETTTDPQILEESDSLHDLNILILDENVHNRISFTSMVNSWGMRTYCFSNVEEALYFTKITDFDIGLVDITIPNIDTFINNKNNLPLIGLTSLGERVIQNHDFVCYLTKPVKESRLKQSILNTLRVKEKCKMEINNSNGNGTALVSEKTESKQNKDTIIPLVNQVLGDHLKTTIRILLAEDVSVNQKVICSFLTKLGFVNIEVVGNGAECLEILKNEEFDIILLDIRMPLMNGDAVLSQIVNYYNENPRGVIGGKFKNKKKPYTIAVTAYCLKDDKDKYIEMGFNDYLPKPIDINDLHNCLNKCINKILCEDDLETN